MYRRQQRHKLLDKNFWTLLYSSFSSLSTLYISIQFYCLIVLLFILTSNLFAHHSAHYPGIDNLFDPSKRMACYLLVGTWWCWMITKLDEFDTSFLAFCFFDLLLKVFPFDRVKPSRTRTTKAYEICPLPAVLYPQEVLYIVTGTSCDISLLLYPKRSN